MSEFCRGQVFWYKGSKRNRCHFGKWTDSYFEKDLCVAAFSFGLHALLPYQLAASVGSKAAIWGHDFSPNGACVGCVVWFPLNSNPKEYTLPNMDISLKVNGSGIFWWDVGTRCVFL